MSGEAGGALLRVLQGSITALPWTAQDAEDLIAELAAIGWHLERNDDAPTAIVAWLRAQAREGAEMLAGFGDVVSPTTLAVSAKAATYSNAADLIEEGAHRATPAESFGGTRNVPTE